MDLHPIDEAELRVSTTLMYKNGGVENVLNAIIAMQKCQNIILKKLNEILDEERGNAYKDD